MEIIKGNRYVCINGTGGFRKGNIYTTNYIGNKIVDVVGSYDPTEHSNYEEYFIPYSKLDKVYTKSTSLLTDIFDKYDGAKNGEYMITPIWFDNCDASFFTGFLSKSSAIEEYYQNNGFTYLSEKAFIEFLDLGKYIGCLNTEPDLLTTPQLLKRMDERADSLKTKVFNPKPYYNNSKGSLYKVATERGWGAYLFDVVKRLERGGKKDPLRQEIEKSIDVLKIWLNEIK